MNTQNKNKMEKPKTQNLKLLNIIYANENKTAFCSCCDKEIKNIFVLSDNKPYGVECAKKLVFGEDYIYIAGKEKIIKKVFDVMNKKRKVIRCYTLERAKELLIKCNQIRNIPLNDLSIKEGEILK